MTREMKRAWLATSVWFMLNGVGWATFTVRFPELKRTLDITNSELGFALFLGSLGALGTLRLAGKWAAKYGSAPVMVWSALAVAATYPVLGLTSNLWAFGGMLLVLMFFTAMMDMAMNAHGVAIEHETGRVIMGRLHALWSLGSLGGGVIGGTLASFDVSLFQQSCIVLVIIAVPVLIFRSLLLPASIDRHEPEHEEHVQHKHPRIFIILGLIALCGTVGEGSALDWGAVLLRDTWQVTAFVASMPHIFFQSGMVIGRVSSDFLAHRFGRARILLLSGLLGGFGLAGGLLIGGPVGIVGGWLCVGLGVSSVFPMVVSIAGVIARKRYAGVIAPSQAVATSAGVAYAAFMIGPPTIGFLADAISLRWAMLVPAVLALGVAAGSRVAQDAGEADE